MNNCSEISLFVAPVIIISKTSNSRFFKLNVLENSNDGFVISEKDLELRGPGDFFGTRQHGLPQLKIANLYQDIDILKKPQHAANYIISSPELFSQFDVRELKDIEL